MRCPPMPVDHAQYQTWEASVQQAHDMLAIVTIQIGKAALADETGPDPILQKLADAGSDARAHAARFLEAVAIDRHKAEGDDA